MLFCAARHGRQPDQPRRGGPGLSRLSGTAPHNHTGAPTHTRSAPTHPHTGKADRPPASHTRTHTHPRAHTPSHASYMSYFLTHQDLCFCFATGRKEDHFCVVCKHTNFVHASSVDLREQGVYATTIANTAGTMSDGQEYHTLEFYFLKNNGRVYLVLEGISTY